MNPVALGLAIIAGGCTCSAMGAVIGHGYARREIAFWRLRAEQQLRRLQAARSDGREIHLFDRNRTSRRMRLHEETPPG